MDILLAEVTQFIANLFVPIWVVTVFGIGMCAIRLAMVRRA